MLFALARLRQWEIESILKTPWYYGWNILGVGMLFQAVIFGIGFFCFTFYVAPWREEFGSSRGDILAILVVVNVVMGVTAPFAGHAMDRLSHEVRFFFILLSVSV